MLMEKDIRIINLSDQVAETTMSFDEPRPGEEETAQTKEKQVLVYHCRAQNNNLMIGCHSNAQHTALISTKEVSNNLI